MDQIVKIAEFILDSFIHIWPYLVITIPIAVAVKISGAAKYVNKALSKKPLLSVLLATIVGAVSPFCSCGVIPVIAALLIGGVPLAPVMSFWIASPSMDPEIFFLSTAAIGWELSVWRLTATFVISLFSGYFTLFAFQKGLLGKNILRSNLSESENNLNLNTGGIMNKIREFLAPSYNMKTAVAGNAPISSSMNCCTSINTERSCTPPLKSSCATTAAGEPQSCSISPAPPKNITLALLLTEVTSASLMVIKFMLLAFFINALISFYAPPEFISSFLGGDKTSSVVTAALIGIPAYTSNITALPLVSGLLGLGMSPGAALAFLIAGPTTTLPAMMAVFGLVRRRIFLLYISYSLAGAIVTGILYNLFH